MGPSALPESGIQVVGLSHVVILIILGGNAVRKGIHNFQMLLFNC